MSMLFLLLLVLLRKIKWNDTDYCHRHCCLLVLLSKMKWNNINNNDNVFVVISAPKQNEME